MLAGLLTACIRGSACKPCHALRDSCSLLSASACVHRLASFQVLRMVERHTSVTKAALSIVRTVCSSAPGGAEVGFVPRAVR